MHGRSKAAIVPLDWPPALLETNKAPGCCGAADRLPQRGAAAAWPPPIFGLAGHVLVGSIAALPGVKKRGRDRQPALVPKEGHDDLLWGPGSP